MIDKIKIMIGADRTAELPKTIRDGTYVLEGTGKIFPTPNDAWNLAGMVNPDDDYVCYGYYVSTSKSTPESEPAIKISADEIESHLANVSGKSAIGKIRTMGWTAASKPCVYAPRNSKIHAALLPILGVDNFNMGDKKDLAYDRFSIPRDLIPVVAQILVTFV